MTSLNLQSDWVGLMNAAKKALAGLLPGTLLASLTLLPAQGQNTDKLIFGAINGMKGAGQANVIKHGFGVSGRFQYPLTANVALTVRLGLEMYRIRAFYTSSSTTLGYGYNPITGYGFNTLYFNYYTLGFTERSYSVPVTFGPRVFLTKEFHTDLNVGVDIAATQNRVSVLHVEPSIGYMLPVGNGGVLDLTAGYFTSFGRGSGVFTVGTAYGIKLSR